MSRSSASSGFSTSGWKGARKTPVLRNRSLLFMARLGGGGGLAGASACARKWHGRNLHAGSAFVLRLADQHQPGSGSMSGESLLVIIIVGLIAGWLAGHFVRGTGFGLVADICIGIIGALIASWLFPRLHIHLGSGIVSRIIAATIGAIILLLILRPVPGRGR